MAFDYANAIIDNTTLGSAITILSKRLAQIRETSWEPCLNTLSFPSPTPPRMSTVLVCKRFLAGIVYFSVFWNANATYECLAVEAL